MHYITEVYIDGAGWCILEPQGGLLGNHGLATGKFPGFLLCAAHGVPTDAEVLDADYLRATDSWAPGKGADLGSLYPTTFKPQQSTMALTYLPASKWLSKLGQGKPPKLSTYRNYGPLPGTTARHVDPAGDEGNHNPASDQPNSTLMGMWCVPNRQRREEAFRTMGVSDAENPMVLANLKKEAALVADLTWHIRECDSKGNLIFAGEGTDLGRLPDFYSPGSDGPPADGGLLKWAIQSGKSEEYKHQPLTWALADFMASEEGQAALGAWERAGKGSAKGMYPILMESGLEKEVLFDIWQLCAPKEESALGKEACVLAFYLVKQAKKDLAKFKSATSAWLIKGKNPRGTLDPAWRPRVSLSGLPKNLWPPSDPGCESDRKGFFAFFILFVLSHTF